MDAIVSISSAVVIIIGAGLVTGLKNTLPGGLMELFGSLVLGGYWLVKLLSSR